MVTRAFLNCSEYGLGLSRQKGTTELNSKTGWNGKINVSLFAFAFAHHSSDAVETLYDFVLTAYTKARHQLVLNKMSWDVFYIVYITCKSPVCTVYRLRVSPNGTGWVVSNFLYFLPQ